ncbi:gag-pol polyprotein [Tanacetum coccineum]
MANVKKSIAERTHHKRQYDRRMMERQMQSRESKAVSSKALDASLVVTKCSGTKSDEHITSSSSGTYITHVVDADIRPVNDQVLSAEVHLTTQHNVQQHTNQSKPSYDTYLLEMVDSNTTPDSTNMCHSGGEIDQNAEHDQVKSPLLKAEFLKTNDIVEKEVYNELSNRFLQLERHCISLEISMQQKEESFQSNKLNLVTCLKMMKGSDIGIQEKMAKLFNEGERFTSTDGESIKQIAQPCMNLGQDNQMQMVRGNGGNQFRDYAVQNVGNQNGYNVVQNVKNQVVQNAVQNPGVQNVGNYNGLIFVLGIANQNRNGNVVVARAEGNVIGNNGNQIRCYNCRGWGHLARNCIVRPRRRDDAYLTEEDWVILLGIAQSDQGEGMLLIFRLTDLDNIEEVNAKCILMAKLQQASTSGTQTNKSLVYDSDRSAEVHNYDNCYDNEIFNMFTQEEQYTELLEPILEPHQVQQNDSNVISEVSSVEQDGENSRSTSCDC